MTRINVIPPIELTHKHLIAEYRELPRVFTLVRNAQAKGLSVVDIKGMPLTYTLGKGHVLFFYPRLSYLLKRQKALIGEMIARGYHPTFIDPDSLIEGLNACWMQDYIPTPEALELNRNRIAEKLRVSAQR